MKKVRIYLLTVCACAALFACSDTEESGIIPDYNYTNKPLNFEATVSTNEENFSGDIVDLVITDQGQKFSLYCDKACCNLKESAVRLELYHSETGDPEYPIVNGTFQITCDNNNLYGTYRGTGERNDCRCSIACDMTTFGGTGIFYTKTTNLDLDIKGVYEQGNPEPVAYRVNITGYLRIPKAGN